jgi:hypothetical protein
MPHVAISVAVIANSTSSSIYTYDVEKRAALERWSSRLTTILEKRPANVISIAG